MQLAGPRHPLSITEALARVAQASARVAILVEGWSDEAAVEAAAQVCGVALAEHGVCVLPMGGITNLGKFAEALAASGLGVRLAGLYDASEEALVWRSLARLGRVEVRSRAAAEAAGFFACERDLEDELIRAVGPEAVERLVAAQDELAAFRRFQAQPEHRVRELHGQLKRFMGTRAGRKIRYGALLAAALAPEALPQALRQLLAAAVAR